MAEMKSVNFVAVFGLLLWNGVVSSFRSDDGIHLNEAEFQEYQQKHPMEFSSYYQGDIDISNYQSFRSARTGATKWPNNTVFFETDLFDLNERYEIYMAMNEIEDATSDCVKFRLKSEKTKNYLNIGPSTSCYSSIGMTGGRQVLGLTFGCVKDRGSIIHELLHALGFRHEQSRPDRDNYVKVFWENIMPGRRQEFEINDADTLGTPYTYGSIMHYGKFAFSYNRLSTILPRKADVEIGRNKLHPIDVERIKRFYGCMPKCE